MNYSSSLPLAGVFGSESPCPPVFVNASGGEQFFKTLVERITVPLVMLDAQRRISYANNTFYQLTGFTSFDVLGLRLDALVPKHQRNLIHHQMLLLGNGKNISFDIQLPIKNGAFVHLGVSVFPFPRNIQEFTGAFTVFSKIAENSMGVTDAVFTAKKELEHTIDSVPDLICVVDRKNVIKRVNMSFARHFNMHPCALIGKNCDELFDFCLPRLSHEQAYPSSAKKNVLQQTIHSDRLGEIQVTVSPFNDSSNNTVGAVYVIHNPHQHVGDKALISHAREKIAAQDELLRTASIIEHVPESVVLTDSNWRISYVNPAFLKMTGLDRRQVLSGKVNLLTFFQHSCLPEKDKIEELMLGKGIWHGSFVVRCKDGSRRDIKAQVSPLKTPGGAITNYVAILCDVTQEVRLARRMRNVEKLEAIGIAAGGTAHDFNNILGGIIGSIELAAEQLEDGDPVRTDLEQALEYAEDAKKLVSQILTFKRQGSPTALPSAGLDLVQSAIAVSRGLVPKGVRIVQNLQPTTWQLVAESTHMHQILMNLCTNAAQAMDGQGEINVTLSEAILEGPLAVYDSQLPEGEYLHLAVRDNGRGIPEEIRDQVFEPLFSTRKNAGGTGMGLPIVHAVAHKLGGGVVLDSRQGRGTTVHVYLPRCIPRRIPQEHPDE